MVASSSWFSSKRSASLYGQEEIHSANTDGAGSHTQALSCKQELRAELMARSWAGGGLVGSTDSEGTSQMTTSGLPRGECGALKQAYPIARPSHRDPRWGSGNVGSSHTQTDAG